jgi:PAS domain-containing protein
MSVVIRPLRFTADVDAMRAFLERLGLQSRIESERGGWVDMLSGRGMVALHDAASSSTGGQAGDTRLTFEVEKLDELKDRLEEAGFADATVFDEAYGRVLSVTAPDGVVIWVDERTDDLYGYTLHDAKPDDRWSVMPCLIGADEAGWRRFLDAVGGDGLVRFEPAGTEFAVRLELATTEALDEIQARVPGQRSGDTLEITDPDGQPLVVHG